MPDDIRLALALVQLAIELAPAVLLLVAYAAAAEWLDGVMSPSACARRRGGRS